MFKLYLYGIEIDLLTADLRIAIGSNCTFMKLKFSMSCEDGYEVTMFKLYLYGIEIAEWGRYCPAGEFKLYLYGIEIRKIRETHVKQIHVQIVPLWN